MSEQSMNDSSFIFYRVFKYGTDGSEITWNNWNPWEPNNMGGNETCVVAANWG